MAGNDGDVLKTSFMIKRSQMKSKITKVNYKSRWFVLTKRALRYHEGNLDVGQGREKGRIWLQNVKAVESVEGELDNRPNAFQIVYIENQATYGMYTLYIVALHAEQRQEWITALREACDNEGAKWNTHYHSGVWMRNKYSCCENINKGSPGCIPITHVPSVSSTKHTASSGMSHSTNIGHSSSFPQLNGDFDKAPDQRGKLPEPVGPRASEQGSMKSRKKVIAIYPYERAESGDLSLETGEEYYILDDSKPFWWKAENRNGVVGYIPSNYVEPITDHGLEKFSWYYKNCSRSQSEEILKQEKKEGCFLVRDSSQAGMYTLSLFTQEVPEGMVRHYHIKKNTEGKLYLSDKHSFTTIPELIFYHKHNSGGLVVRLRNSPMDRENSLPTTAGFGHSKWEINPDEIEVTELLGSGQFGTVRRGMWRKNKEVAVKEMQTGTMREDDFIDEARTMMQFQHKHLVQLYGVCTEKKPIYIVLEYMRYGALLQYLRRRKSTLLRDTSQLIEMCVQICSAMKYLESKQFIHRDLAARNCLVGDNRIVKVGDFGLARYVLDDEYTSSSGTKFPVKWAPPEVLSYTKFSSKSDVWAYGVLIWEIWTGGDMPYGKMRNPEVVERVCHGHEKLPKPSACPTNVYDIMKDCWRHGAEQRPSFIELYDLLTRLVEEKDYAG